MATFNVASHVVGVIALPLTVVFFTCQPVQIIVAVAAIQYDIRQNASSGTFSLFAVRRLVRSYLKLVCILP
ncbi:hypothetical protein [Snodgrassella sp. M0110]|uniref:hypothetical protein n=1 Tax=Snodgrassella sp. M0110 TaxID=2750973 RepID=UPI0018DE70D2|nr:hypothetical protein [Snodgrassella sp. M0110]MBI0068913.1 hypothetical protein [Snodgrassella sp. M0110]